MRLASTFPEFFLSVKDKKGTKGKELVRSNATAATAGLSARL